MFLEYYVQHNIDWWTNVQTPFIFLKFSYASNIYMLLNCLQFQYHLCDLDSTAALFISCLCIHII